MANNDIYKIEITFSLTEFAAIVETADLNNDMADEWAKRTLLNATVTNDEERFGIRREIESGAAHSKATLLRHSVVPVDSGTSR